MKVLVTGVGGQLGHDVVSVFEEKDVPYFAPIHSDMDITDKNAVNYYFDKVQPDAVVHCAAYTSVDKAEDESELCRRVNVIGTRNIVDNCIRRDIPIVYISTDYVFNGSGNRPWQPLDATDPINVYGLSKRDGEIEVQRHLKHFIIRISWVFGINGNNFIKTMKRLSDTVDVVNVVDDQFGSPTYTRDLAYLILSMISTNKYGIYHAHNEGVCTWADLAEETFQMIGTNTRVKRIRSDQYPMKAKRPANSRLSTDCLRNSGFSLLPDWKNALKRFIQELSESESEG